MCLVESVSNNTIWIIWCIYITTMYPNSMWNYYTVETTNTYMNVLLVPTPDSRLSTPKTEFKRNTEKGFLIFAHLFALATFRCVRFRPRFLLYAIFETTSLFRKIKENVYYPFAESNVYNIQHCTHTHTSQNVITLFPSELIQTNGKRDKIVYTPEYRMKWIRVCMCGERWWLFLHISRLHTNM